MTIFAATGHRPEKLGGYSDYARRLLYEFALETLRPYAPKPFAEPDFKMISGMAQGWDTAVAQACVMLRIPMIAAVPFVGQESKWPDAARREYDRLLVKAENIVCVSQGGYAVEKMQIRNEWMTDHCDKLVALWNGTPGGTANCVGYATRIGKPWVNIWDGWATKSIRDLV